MNFVNDVDVVLYFVLLIHILHTSFRSSVIAYRMRFVETFFVCLIGCAVSYSPMLNCGVFYVAIESGAERNRVCEDKSC